MSKTPWMDIAEKYVGTKEIVGRQHNPVVVGFFAKAGHPEIKDDETAWCSAFVNACMYEVGIKGTNNLLARSWLNWGDKTTAPRYGDVVIMRRGNSSWQGHVFFFLSMDDNYVYGLGGNQSNGVTKAKFRRSEILGYRRVSANPAPAELPEMTQKRDIEVTAGDKTITFTGIISAIQTYLMADGVIATLILLGFLAFVGYSIWKRHNEPLAKKVNKEWVEAVEEEVEPEEKKPAPKKKKAASSKAKPAPKKKTAKKRTPVKRKTTSKPVKKRSGS